MAGLSWTGCIIYRVLGACDGFKEGAGIFPSNEPSLNEASSNPALAILTTYSFWASLLVFPAYVILPITAARANADGILSTTQKGTISEDALAEIGWETLPRLDLLQINPEPQRRFLLRSMAWAVSGAGRRVCDVKVTKSNETTA